MYRTVRNFKATYITQAAHNSIAVCCKKISVNGKGGAFDSHPNIFTPYTLESDLVNGREHYISQDGNKAITYNKGWIIQKQEDR